MYAAPGYKINDVYIHHSAINFSEITGILYNGNTEYDARHCDTNPNVPNDTTFANNQAVSLPRNIRIENNTFYGNRTGAMGGGARWVGLRDNYFANNYTYPQAGNEQGGTVEFDECSDKVEIMRNTLTAPAYTPSVPT